MSQSTEKFLSIVTPTREGFSDHWIRELMKIKGDVDFIWVHPPGSEKRLVDDPRVHQIISPLRGEIIQRMIGLMNVSSPYILTINCDEYLTPDILEITQQYFDCFPDSWVMRLDKKFFDFGDQAGLESSWETFPNISELKLKEIPISPVDNQFDVSCFFRPRKDLHGAHTENFDKKVWKNQLVQETLKEFDHLMTLQGPLKYIPFWCLDRVLGLAIQAKFYEKDKIIGHLLPSPEQLRVEDNPPEYRKSKRFYLFAEMLLIRRFPESGYFWNMIVDQLRGIPGRGLSFLYRKITRS
jgi:hypothetical protein